MKQIVCDTHEQFIHAMADAAAQGWRVTNMEFGQTNSSVTLHIDDGQPVSEPGVRP